MTGAQLEVARSARGTDWDAVWVPMFEGNARTKQPRNSGSDP